MTHIKMTLLQKIKATTWYNSILKHREILLEFLSLTDDLETRVEDLENSSGGTNGGVETVTGTAVTGTADNPIVNLQNLQQTLDQTPRFWSKTEGDYTYTFNVFEGGFFEIISLNNITNEQNYINIEPNVFSSSLRNADDNNSIILNNGDTGFTANYQNQFGVNDFRLLPRTSGDNTEHAVFNLPNNKPTGDYNLGLETKVISADKVAVNNENYVVTDDAIFTDPTGEEGKGYIVYVRKNSATIGGISYGEGSLVYRFSDGGGWNSKDFGAGGDSQWTTEGSDIYYNDGKVGIGTATPIRLLTVQGDFLCSTLTGSGFVANNSGVSAIGDVDGGARGNSLTIEDDVDKAYLYNNNTNVKFGINTFNPIVALDVVGDSNISGALNTIGSIYENTNRVLTEATGVVKGVNNATTTVLTSGMLNVAYPTATTGFRVYCTSIIAGAMVYEKTPTGWIGTTVFIP